MFKFQDQFVKYFPKKFLKILKTKYSFLILFISTEQKKKRKEKKNGWC